MLKARPKRAKISVGEVKAKGTLTGRVSSEKWNGKEVQKKVQKKLYPKVTAVVHDIENPITVAIAKKLVGWEQLPDLPKPKKGDPAEWQEGTGGTEKTVKKTIVKDGKRTVVYEPAKPITSKNKDWKGKDGDGKGGQNERRSQSRETPMLIDLYGKRIVLRANDKNRPFRLGLAKRYMNEVLNKRWKLNGETIILDWFGKVHNGQHTLVGLILANQAWEIDRQKQLQTRKGQVPSGGTKQLGDHGGVGANGKPRKHGLEETGAAGEAWSKIWREAPVIHKIVTKGIDPDCADTIDQGQKRSLGDVFYRDSRFGKGMDRKARKRLNDILAKAVRLVWLRSGGVMVSNAPHFPVSEAIEFVDQHEKLVETVMAVHVMEEDGDGRNISNYLSPGYAAALFYLMATSGTDPDEYLERGVDALDFSMEDKATKFWDAFSDRNGIRTGGAEPDSSGASKGTTKDRLLGATVSLLRQRLQRIDAGSGSARDEIAGTVVKAFNAWVDGLAAVKAGKPAPKLTMDDIEVSKIEDEEIEGHFNLDEEPRLGGLDTRREPEEELAPEPAPKTKKGRGSSVGEVSGRPAKGAKAGKTPKGKRNTGKTGKHGVSQPAKYHAGNHAPAKVAAEKLGKRDIPATKMGNMAGDKWAEGDQCWVVEKDSEPWFGEVDLISDDGKKAFVTGNVDGKQWEVSITALSIVHPEA